MSAIVYNADGTIYRRVKNLGWLLKHHNDIVALSVVYPDSGTLADYDFILIGHLNDGRYYVCPYASWRVALRRFWFRSIWVGKIVHFIHCNPGTDRLEYDVESGTHIYIVGQCKFLAGVRK